MKIFLDVPGIVVSTLSGEVNGHKLNSKTHDLIQMTVVPELEFNDVLIQIDDLPGSKRQNSAIRTLLGVMAMPLTNLGYDRDANLNESERFSRFERKTEYVFGSGEKIKVTQNANGIVRNGQFELDVNFFGNIPEINAV